MYTTIEIDFEVYKQLTIRLKSPQDTYNDVVRELLELDAAPKQPTRKRMSAANGRAWEWKGVTFPHGTELKAMYNGKEHRAEVKDGAIVYSGKEYSSPSAAAGAVTHTSVNGWKFWECKLPGHAAWTLIDNLRRN